MIRYPQICNGSILNTFKNNATPKICRTEKKEKKKKEKGDDGYGLNIFMVINVHKKHFMFFYPP
jgi:hypothetical protein